VMFGKVTNQANEKLPDLNLREWACLIPLTLAALWIGIYPSPVLQYLEEPAHAIVMRVNPEYFSAGAARGAVTGGVPAAHVTEQAPAETGGHADAPPPTR